MIYATNPTDCIRKHNYMDHDWPYRLQEPFLERAAIDAAPMISQHHVKRLQSAQTDQTMESTGYL